MHPVESSSIRAIGYDEAAAALGIIYHSRPDTYVYFDVPESVYGALERAESKGRYVNHVIKPHFQCERRRRGGAGGACR
jgi:hypothetical protein